MLLLVSLKFLLAPIVRENILLPPIWNSLPLHLIFMPSTFFTHLLLSPPLRSNPSPFLLLLSPLCTHNPPSQPFTTFPNLSLLLPNPFSFPCVLCPRPSNSFPPLCIQRNCDSITIFFPILNTTIFFPDTQWNCNTIKSWFCYVIKKCLFMFLIFLG